MATFGTLYADPVNKNAGKEEENEESYWDKAEDENEAEPINAVSPQAPSPPPEEIYLVEVLKKLKQDFKTIAANEGPEASKAALKKILVALSDRFSLLGLPDHGGDIEKYTTDEKSAIAYILGALQLRFEYMDMYVDGDDGRAKTIKLEYKTNEEVILTNPDLSFKEKFMLLKHTVDNEPSKDFTLEQLNNKNNKDIIQTIVNAEKQIQENIKDKAGLFFKLMKNADEEMQNSFIAATGGGSNTSGILERSGAATGVGSGYFSYQLNSEGFTKNIITIEPTDAEQDVVINIRAYGFDYDNAILNTTITFVPESNDLNFSSSNLKQSKTIKAEVHKGRIIEIKTARNGKFAGDEAQILITTNANFKSTTERKTVEAKDLFASGNFATDLNKLNTTDPALVAEIKNFAAGLAPKRQIIEQQLSANPGLVLDISDIFSLEGFGISKQVPIPKKLRDKPEMAGKNTKELQHEIERFNKDDFDSYYKEEFPDLDHEKVIKELKKYRSSSASTDGRMIRITSTTDPQGTGTNAGKNNDFSDFYTRNTKKRLQVEFDKVIVKEDGKISRQNNDALSGLRSVAFLKLLLRESGMADNILNSLTVKVKVKGTILLVYLADIENL